MTIGLFQLFAGSVICQTVTDPEVCRVRNERRAATLDRESPLLILIHQGRTGDGITHSWMERMKDLGVKEATVRARYREKTIGIFVIDVDTSSMRFWSSYYYTPSGKSINTESRRESFENLSNELKPIFEQRAMKQLAALPLRGEQCGTVEISLIDDACFPVIYSPPQGGECCDAFAGWDAVDEECVAGRRLLRSCVNGDERLRDEIYTP